MDIYKIKNGQSRVDFECVLQAYYAKDYKASILLLYNLVVNDLYKKMVLMNELGYIDLGRELEEIEKKINGEEKQDDKYSVIEKKIFTTYKDRCIVGDSTISFLKYLKETRDMCAHPFVFGEKNYTPEASLVFAFISKAYNDILTIGAFFKKPYEIIDNEIDKHIYPKFDSGMAFVFNKQYAEDEIRQTEKILNRYFIDFTDDNLKQTFKTTLDLIINKRSEEIQKKQYANFLVLNAILNYMSNNGKKSVVENFYDWEGIKIDNLKDEKSDFFNADWLAQTYLYEILLKNNLFLNEIKNKNHDIFELLETSIYKKAEYFIDYWSIFETDINKAIKKLEGIRCAEYCEIVDAISQELDTENLVDLFDKMFTKVPTFNGYDDASKCLRTFVKIIEKDPKRFSQDVLNDIFEIINSNRQIYDKIKGAQEEKLTKLGYDFSNYTSIKQAEEGDYEL